MRADSPRWREVTASEFPHEREGLAHVRDLLPDRKPFRAWSNFEFRDQHGKWHEVDLLVLGERRLHLVELKYYAGTITGSAYRWQRNGHAQDTPLLLAERKAKRLRSVITDKLKSLAPDLSRHDVPYIQHSALLHHKNGRCELPPNDKTDLFGRDDTEGRSGLPSVAVRLLEPLRERQPGLIAQDDLLVNLFDEIGFTVRREHEVGSWRLTGPVLAEGDGWQDWPAEHRVRHTQTTRIRFFVSNPGASRAELAARRKLVEREYDMTRELRHDGLLCPIDLVDDELGAGLVYNYDEHWRPLDLWLADRAGSLSVETQVRLVRRVAEALGYAHRNHVIHRGLCPRAIAVDDRGDEVEVKLGDWQSAGVDDSAAGQPTGGAATRVLKLLGDDVVGAQGTEAYIAPEGRWDPAADRVRLDLFALGAVAYHVVAGRAPASNATDLRERVHKENGLDLAGELSEVPAELRRLVLEATRPVVSERLPDVAAFLERLDQVDRDLAGPGIAVEVDPLDAPPGTLLDGRYELVRRLGSGSTALGLLVKDHAGGGEVVLKVALDDAAIRRLELEAETLRALRGKQHPRLVRMVEDAVVQVGGRAALVLESAGTQTLADELHERPRLSLDLLERWGNDLLEALVDLDRTGIDHRDIKPANLGVRNQPADRAPHLALFDFSLSRTPAESVEVGTPQYRDPFLGTGTRRRWDSAAERWAAAATLHEMATGRLPRFGDGQSDPAVIPDEATLDPGWFDRVLAGGLGTFFRRALRRDAAERHHTAAEMAAEWRAVFSTPTTPPDDADRLADAATPDTPLAEAGLSARALSAVEPMHVLTVADLVRFASRGRLVRLRGVAEPTRKELRQRVAQWRDKYPELRTAAEPQLPATTAEGPLADPVRTADAMVDAAGSKRATKRRRAAKVLLGLEGEVPAFATLAEFTSTLDVATTAAVSIAFGHIQDAWAADDTTCETLDIVDAMAREALAGLGGLATSDALVAELARRTGSEPDASTVRLVAGLIRAAFDHTDIVVRGGEERDQVWRRRRRSDGRVLLAVAPELLDAADGLVDRAERLVDTARGAGDPLVPAGRAAEMLRPLWPTGGESDVPPVDDATLVRLAARLSEQVSASRRGELHDRDLAAHDALRLALSGLGPSQQLTPDEIRSWVRARFPDLPELPGRPRLDELVREARLELQWDGSHYTGPSRPADVTALASRSQFPAALPGRYGAGEDERLRRSVAERSYLAIGVRARDYDDFRDGLAARFNAALVDVTRVLLDALRSQATAAGIPWEEVRAADAAEPGTRPAQGLAKLVSRTLPAVEAAVEAAAQSAPEGTRPVLLVEAAPLAAYEHTELLSRLADITLPRRQAVWLLLPSDANRMLDRVPVPLAHGGQFVRLGGEWLHAAAAKEGAE